MSAFRDMFKTKGAENTSGAASEKQTDSQDQVAPPATEPQPEESGNEGPSTLVAQNPDTVTGSDLAGIDSMADLWPLTVEIWQHGLMGVDIGRIIIAIVIFAVFLMLRGLFGKYVLLRLQNWTARSATDVDDRVIDALIPPIKMIPIILGLFLSFQYAGLDVVLGDIFDKFIRTLIVFSLFWALFRALNPLSQTLTPLREALSPIMVSWMFKVISVLVIFIGGAIILEIWGIRVGPLLAGLGLLGAAVALGAQDIFKNLIGGVTVIAERRFRIGDWVKIDGVVEGVVEDIGIRSTEIRQFDKAPVHVPNAHLSDAAVSNYSRMSHRRIYWLIGLEFRTSVDQLKLIRDGIHSYIEQNDDFDKSVSTFVRVDSFADSAINIMVYCFTKTTEWAEWLEIREALAVRVKEVVEDEAGAGFAFPSQSLYLEKWPEGGRPEVYLPPEGQESQE